MTPFEIDLANSLNRVSGWTGARFIQSIARIAQHNPDQELTLRQRHYMEIIAWRYRRQLPSDMVPEGKPLSMPSRAPTPKKVRPSKAVIPVERVPDLFTPTPTPSGGEA